MDTTTTFPNSNRAGPPWTDEKHMHFLKYMEASFVHTMFQNNGRLLRLDRQLPDSSDSTLDLKKHTPNKHVNPAAAADIIGSRNSKAVKRPKRHSYQPYTSSQDQVVPRMENRQGDNDDSGPPNGSSSTTCNS